MAADHPDQFSVEIRDAQETDAGAIWRIHTGCIEKLCSTHYSKADIEQWAGRQAPEKYLQFIGQDDFIVAVCEDRVVGFGHMGTCEDHEKFVPSIQLEVKGLYVSPEAVGKGTGRALFGELEGRAVERGCRHLRVCSTLTAVPFYESCGFVVGREVFHRVGGHSLRCKVLEKQLKIDQTTTTGDVNSLTFSTATKNQN